MVMAVALMTRRESFCLDLRTDRMTSEEEDLV